MKSANYAVRRLGAVVFLHLLLLSTALVGSAQDSPSSEPRGIEWQRGPIEADLGGVATIKIPKGMQFADGNGARRFLELNHNPPSGDEVGVLMPQQIEGRANQDWFMLFDFHEVGYVSDSDKESLDANALLSSVTKGTEKANEKRKERGWSAFHIIGWSQPPFYDEKTKNLTWAILGKDEDAKADDQTINYSVRILGRRGTMNVDLILEPQQMSAVMPQFNVLMNGFSYKPGSRYAEFMKGDKVAGYGLTALIAGGAAAAAVKTGLFAKLLKILTALVIALWKFVILLFAAIASRFRSLIRWVKRLFSRKKDPDYSVAFEAEQKRLGGGDADGNLL